VQMTMLVKKVIRVPVSYVTLDVIKDEISCADSLLPFF
jgi:hypothetical protein